MSITPHRDAAIQTVEQARRLNAAKPEGAPWQNIARRMDIDATEAVMVGWGELRDLGEGASHCGQTVNRVLASAVASFLMTACGGREEVASRILDGFLFDLRSNTLERIGAARTEGISAVVTPSEPQGRA